jgi:hypothetical protein
MTTRKQVDQQKQRAIAAVMDEIRKPARPAAKPYSPWVARMLGVMRFDGTRTTPASGSDPGRCSK